MTINEGHLAALVNEINQPIIASVTEAMTEIQSAQQAFNAMIMERDRHAQRQVFGIGLHIELAITLAHEAINLAGQLNPEAAATCKAAILSNFTKTSEALLLTAQSQAVRDGFSEVLEDLTKEREAFLVHLKEYLL